VLAAAGRRIGGELFDHEVLGRVFEASCHPGYLRADEGPLRDELKERGSEGLRVGHGGYVDLGDGIG